MVRSGLVPFHAWLPDVYAQAPSGITALLSGLVTKLGLIGALRAVATLAGATLSLAVVLMGFGVRGMLVGNLLALRQRQLKRPLASSSLAHLATPCSASALVCTSAYWVTPKVASSTCCPTA